MASTVIVAVRQAVVAAVADLPAFADVEVRYAQQATTGREYAFTGGATFAHEPASMKAGRNFRKETGGFDFVITVEVPGGTPEDAAVRALELGLAFEEWVADNKNLDAVAAVDWLQVKGEGSLQEAPVDQGAIAQIVYHVEFNARLT